MRTVEDCLENLQDEDYAYTNALIHDVDQEQAEGTLKALCRAEGDRDILLWAKSLRQAINDAMFERASDASEMSRTPLDEPVTAYDVRKYDESLS